MRIGKDVDSSDRSASSEWHSVVLRRGLWVGVAVLTALTLLSQAGGEAVTSDVNVLALGFAGSVVLLALYLRRYLGAVLALLGGAVNAVWLMPVVLAPQVVAADIPDGATRLASIEHSVAGYAPDRAFAAVDRHAPEATVTPVLSYAGAPIVTISTVRLHIVTPADGAAGLGPREGTIVVRWLRYVWPAEDSAGQRTPALQRI